MPLTRKITAIPVIIPSDTEDATIVPASAPTTKATSGPGPHHVRVHRSDGAGSERVIRPAAPLALTQ